MWSAGGLGLVGAHVDLKPAAAELSAEERRKPRGWCCLVPSVKPLRKASRGV